LINGTISIETSLDRFNIFGTKFHSRSEIILRNPLNHGVIFCHIVASGDPVRAIRLLDLNRDVVIARAEFAFFTVNRSQ